jgi:hypothetical protein
VITLVLGDVANSPGVGNSTFALAVDHALQISGSQSGQEFPIRGPYLLVIISNGLEVAIAPNILAARAHGKQGVLLKGRSMVRALATTLDLAGSFRPLRLVNALSDAEP